MRFLLHPVSSWAPIESWSQFPQGVTKYCSIAHSSTPLLRRASPVVVIAEGFRVLAAFLCVWICVQLCAGWLFGQQGPPITRARGCFRWCASQAFAWIKPGFVVHPAGSSLSWPWVAGTQPAAAAKVPFRVSMRVSLLFINIFHVLACHTPTKSPPLCSAIYNISSQRATLRNHFTKISLEIPNYISTQSV